MKKLLHFPSMVLLALLCTMNAFAVEVTDEITYVSLGLTENSTAYKDFSGKTITSAAVYAGNASTGELQYLQLRSQKPCGIITTASGGKIVSVTVTWNSKTTAERQLDIYGRNEAYTSSENLYSSSEATQGTKLGSIKTSDANKTLTITGDYTYIGIRSYSGAQYIDKIEVVWDANETPTPELKITGTTPFIGSTTVTITPSNADNAVYYTLDGSDPSESGNSAAVTYSAPFDLTATTTVKAYEEGAELTAEKTFIKEQTPEVNNIAEFRALAENTQAILNLNNAQVVYTGTISQKPIAFVRDASSAIAFFDTDITLTANQIINGKAELTYTLFNKLPQATKNANTNADNLTFTDGTEAQPVTCTINEAKEKLCDYVYIENLTPKSITSGTNTRYYGFNEAGDSIQLYDQFKITGMAASLAALDPAKKYNVKGISGIYNTYHELFVTEIEEVGGSGEDPQVQEVNNIAEFRALNVGTEAILKLENTKVLYSWTSNAGNTMTFIRDASAALELYNSGLSLAANQDVNGTVNLAYLESNNMPEGVATKNTNADNLTIADGTEAQPVTCTINEAKGKLCDLVYIENLTPKSITSGTNTHYYGFNEAGDSIQLYNQFHLDGMDATLAGLDASKKYNVTGISAIYKTFYEIFITKIEEATIDAINDIDAAFNEENAPLYNLAGQRVDNTYKGVVIKQGKKYLKR